jgi:prefoldin subunit 5
MVEILATKIEALERRIEKLENREDRLRTLELANAELRGKLGIVAFIIATISAAVVSFLFKILPG